MPISHTRSMRLRHAGSFFRVPVGFRGSLYSNICPRSSYDSKDEPGINSSVQECVNDMIYAVSDLSGCYNSWKKILDRIAFHDGDEMFVLGNILDQGKFPIRLLQDMAQRPNVFPIMGSAEYRFLKYMRNIPTDAQVSDFRKHLSKEETAGFSAWITEGGRNTFEQYMKHSPEDREAILDYLDEFVLYETAETPAGRFVMTHSGIDHFKAGKPLDSYDAADFLWNDAAPYQEYDSDFTVWYGHIPTMDIVGGEAGKMYRTKTAIGIDCGVIRHKEGGTLGCLRLDDLKEFYL